MKQTDKNKLIDNNSEIEQHIDDILGNDDVIDNEAEKSEMMPLSDIIVPYSYDEATTKSINKAKKLLLSLLDFYLSEDFINNNAYVKQKAELDEAGLSQIIKQVGANDRMIEIIMKTIDTGQLAPRMFEVFSTLQRTQLELLKMQTMYVVNMEETVKKIKQDYDYFKKDTKEVGLKHDSEDDEYEDSTTYRGTRQLMKELATDEDFEFDEQVHTDDPNKA